MAGLIVGGIPYIFMFWLEVIGLLFENQWHIRCLAISNLLT
jgi:hypothetical protein